MSQYTKGEWQVKYDYGAWQILHNGKSIATVYNETNTQLIASAPNLYEACKFAEYMIRNETWDFKPERDKALELLSEALEKARVK